MGASPLRHRPGRAALGPGALGHVWHGLVSSLGERLFSRRGRVGQPWSVAVAGRSGRTAGRWVWHDLAPDTGAVPRQLHRVWRAGHRVLGDDCGAGFGAE